MYKILSVTVVREEDTDPDLSWIGEYSSKPGPNAIDRQERKDWQRGEFRYCNITLSAEETGNPESVELDYRRMEAYGKDWWMLGFTAKAKVQFTHNGAIQELTSGGLWGIESDGGEDYFKEVADEQLHELRSILMAAGATDEMIEEAYSRKEVS